MACHTQGIQLLLAAERRAADKIAEAKKRKGIRLKQAKAEAEIEIEKYRQEREKQFKEFEIKHLEFHKDDAAKIDADTKIQIEEINKAVTVNKQAVVEKILEVVYDIKPELHKNFKATVNNE